MTDDFTFATWLHVSGAAATILGGALVLTGRKGTRRHRRFGYFYLVSMAQLLAGAALMPATFMPLLGTRFGFFHIFLVIGTVSLLLGLASLRRWRRHRDPRALRAHQIHLAYSYAGVLMAGLSQLFANPLFRLTWFETQAGFWMTFILVNGAVYAVAVYLIHIRGARGEPRRFAPASSGKVVA